MISETIRKKECIFEICKNSGPVAEGARLRSAIIADRNDVDQSLAKSEICCCGNVSEDEMLFRTADGSIFFSIRDGWGERDGILYGLHLGFWFDFLHPTNSQSIEDACATALGSYHSWGGAIAYWARKSILETICAVMGRTDW